MIILEKDRKPGRATIALRRAATPSVRPLFFAATENPRLRQELQGLLDGLMGEANLEFLPEDGTIALHRLKVSHPRLAFLPWAMRQIEALTVLRALPPGRARRVVLIAPDTVDGQRVAWEALSLGACDVLATRGSPPHRFKGSVAQRLRQIAHLLAQEEGNYGGADPAEMDELLAVPGRYPDRGEERDPWVVLPETRSLAAVARWLRGLTPDVPVVLRIPEGPRFVRAVREGLGRLLQWPVRSLLSGDRLVAGQVHLFGEGERIRVEGNGGHPGVRLAPLADPPGSWPAYHGFLQDLRASDLALRILTPEGEDQELETYLTREGAGPHSVYHLERVAREPTT